MKFILLVCSTILINIQVSAQNYNWSSWKTTSCYQGIDFAVKRGPYNQYAQKYTWYIMFRNRYNGDVYFSFTAKEPNIRTADTNFRINLGSQEESQEYQFLINDPNDIGVFVQKVRFNQDTGNYANCQ